MSSLHTSSPRAILVSAEGNIGSGKTTLLKEMKEKYTNYHYIPEPVSEWSSYTDESGKNILELFYENKERYGYTFQTMAFITRVINISKAITEWEKECQINPAAAANNVFITERCIETDYNVFAKMLYDDKIINKVEMDLYLTWFNHLRDKCDINGIVYVNTPPTICKERIGVRNRSGEEGIPLAYLENLDKYHTQWLTNIDVQMLTFINSGDDRYSTLEDVVNFINSLSSSASCN